MLSRIFRSKLLIIFSLHDFLSLSSILYKIMETLFSGNPTHLLHLIMNIITIIFAFCSIWLMEWKWLDISYASIIRYTRFMRLVVVLACAKHTSKMLINHDLTKKFISRCIMWAIFSICSCIDPPKYLQ